MTTELQAAAAEIRRNAIRSSISQEAMQVTLQVSKEHGWSNVVAVNAAYASAHAVTRKDD